MTSTSHDDASHYRSVSRTTVLIARFVTYLIYAYLIVVEIILTLGFVLLLLGANPSSEFARWVYRSLDRAMGPFDGLFNPIEVTNTDTVSAVFDTSILFAMVAYGIVLALLSGLLDWMSRKIADIDLERRLRSQQAAYDANARTATSVPPDVVGEAVARNRPNAPGVGQ